MFLRERPADALRRIASKAGVSGKAGQPQGRRCRRAPTSARTRCRTLAAMLSPPPRSELSQTTILPIPHAGIRDARCAASSTTPLPASSVGLCAGVSAHSRVDVGAAPASRCRSCGVLVLLFTFAPMLATPVPLLTPMSGEVHAGGGERHCRSHVGVSEGLSANKRWRLQCRSLMPWWQCRRDWAMFSALDTELPLLATWRASQSDIFISQGPALMLRVGGTSLAPSLHKFKASSYVCHARPRECTVADLLVSQCVTGFIEVPRTQAPMQASSCVPRWHQDRRPLGQ